MSYYYPYSSYSSYLDARYGYRSYYDYPYYSRYYDSPYYSRYYDSPYYSRYYPYYYDPVTYTSVKTVVADPLPTRALSVYDPVYDSAYWRSRYLYDSPYYSRYPYYSSYYRYSPYSRYYYW